ncbi:MAG TPA: hypothetical protein ENJ95_16620 [Bacteroidetes bacterium]|nr:hypothetical protein [Bacteroidota bacterium]
MALCKSKEEVILRLCDGYSVQSKILNKFWALLVLSSALVIIGAPNSEKLIKIPLLSGEVSPTDFYQISIVLISMLTLGFSSAMTQSIRIRKLMNKVIDTMEEKLVAGGVHIRDLTDGIITPTFNRVAPISQFLIGENQFLNEGKQSKLLRIIGILLYSILKVSLLVFLYGIPSYAFFKCWSFLVSSNIVHDELLLPKGLLIYITAIAFLLLILLFVSELRYTIKVFIHVKKETK